MSKVMSEDSVRSNFGKMDEIQGVIWLEDHLGYCVRPLLSELWILDADVTVKPLSLLQNSAAAAADKWECFASPDCRARACACRQRNVRIADHRNIDHTILRKAARRTASAPGVAPALGCGSD